MATTKKAPAAKEIPVEGMRRCSGSEKFGIKAHDARIEVFPAQPSQKDGLGRLCQVHWAAYTRGLRQAAIARQPAPVSVTEVERAHADNAGAKAATSEAKPKGKPAPKAKPVVKPMATPNSRTEPAAVKHAAGVAVASTSDDETAEQDAILAERKSRVKSWRRQEAERALAGG